MNLEDCIKGYELLSIAFQKVFKEAMIEKIWQEYFEKQNGKKFIQACRNLGHTQDRFPPIAMIYDEMKNITVEYDEELNIESCGKCERGLIYKTDEKGYSYVNRCTCKAGQQKKYNGLWTVDRGYLEELDVKKPVSDREYQISMNQMWDKLERPKMKKDLPPAGTYFNSEHYKGAEDGSLKPSPHWDGDRSRFVGGDEIRKLVQALSGTEDESREAERARNIKNKGLEDLPF